MNKVEAAREWICSHNDGDVLYVKDAFVSGVNWTIDKACEWLEPVLKNYAGYYVGEDILEDFKKYIEK